MRQLEKKSLPKFENDFKWPTLRRTVKASLLYCSKSKAVMESSPVSGSVLNEIGKLGLLSYQDFCFLLALISTPK